MATIGLCMIVKDEAGVITHYLESVRRLVDFVMIEDTGSSDSTQEVLRKLFFSLYAAAQLKEWLGLSEQEVIAAYLEAAGALPTRAEALHGASRFCRTKSRHEEGFQLARQGLAIGRPSDRTHIGSWIYEYGLQVTTDGHEYQAPDSTSVHTRNILLRLSDDVDIQSVAEILPPAEMPEPACKLVLGFQDLRLFTWRGELWDPRACAS